MTATPNHGITSRPQTDPHGWFATHDGLTIVALRDPLLDSLGHHPASSFAERYWLPTLGPSALWLHRNLVSGLERHPGGFHVHLPTLAREVGLGASMGRNAPLVRTLSRLLDFRVAEIIDGRLGVYTKLPPLSTTGKPPAGAPRSPPRGGIRPRPITPSHGGDHPGGHLRRAGTVSRTPLDAALRYAERGWAVLPCHEPAAVGCSCRRSDCASPAKHPRTRDGLLGATTDTEMIAGWWRRWPTSNVGVRTGAASGVVVLDVDIDKGGLAALHDLQRLYGPLPPGPAVRTGSGGRHYWFSHPGHQVRNSASRLGPGLDVRGDGGYVIAPPSHHPNGRRYLWVSSQPLHPAPDWLIQILREPVHQRPVIPDGHRPVDLSHWARAAFEGEVTRVQHAHEGTRNHTLNRAAFALGQLVGAGHLHEDHVRDALTSAGLGVGLSPTEVRATVTSGLRAGSRLPRSPSDHHRQRQGHAVEIA